MRVVKVFFLGFLYGWFMKLILDEIYTKDHLRMITNENTLLKERIKLFEQPRLLESKSIQITPPQPVQPVEPVPTPRPVRRIAPEKDDLKQIKGVGPQMEKKLNGAGVNTFEQMSRLTTTDLQNILGISKRVVQSADNLITQAKMLAQQKTRNE